jgi:hypothetical protein
MVASTIRQRLSSVGGAMGERLGAGTVAYLYERELKSRKYWILSIEMGRRAPVDSILDKLDQKHDLKFRLIP